VTALLHLARRSTIGAACAAAAAAAALAQSPAFAPTTRDFPLVGGNLANQRYSSLKAITPANVSKLGGAWMVHLEDGQIASMQGTPVVVDGVLYIGSGSGKIFAIDAATGERLWTYQPTGGGQTNRGVTVAQGKVFSGQGGNRLVALDQKTGRLVWETVVGDRGGTPGATIYANGLVFAGVAGGESGVRGHFGAYDAKTGKLVWNFNTIPGPGEFGHDTWEGDSWERGGGPVWTHPAVDPELGVLYLPVGNAYPDTDGSRRGGVRKWHFQEVHHDLWDYDNQTPPVLADVRVGGQIRRLLIHGGKTGFTYILDRTDGRPVVGIEERPVPQEPSQKTAKTQPFPIGDTVVPTCPEQGSVAAGSRTACVFAAYRADDPVVTTPGTQGGFNWAPMTFSPLTNLIYVPASIINSQFGPGFSRPVGQPRAGTLTAIDPATNRIVWQKRTKFPLGTGSGLLSTAGGLLFHGESDGNVVAYDIRNGDVLWSFQTGAGADAPVATYEVNGEQYVAILAGGNTFQLSQRGDHLWAFKIGGTVAPRPAPPEPPTTQPAAGRRGGGGGR
jgi:PQQ-dependent dehydrogenase (methanol/ethanol family)